MPQFSLNQYNSSSRHPNLFVHPNHGQSEQAANEDDGHLLINSCGGQLWLEPERSSEKSFDATWVQQDGAEVAVEFKRLLSELSLKSGAQRAYRGAKQQQAEILVLHILREVEEADRNDIVGGLRAGLYYDPNKTIRFIVIIENGNYQGTFEMGPAGPIGFG